jgi:hypothetical protein
MVVIFRLLTDEEARDILWVIDEPDEDIVVDEEEGFSEEV